MVVEFILNNQTVSPTGAQGSTLLDFIRYTKRLTGTKIGCREGDCGACTVLAGSFEDDKLVYRSVTACLMPIGNAHHKHIVTVEGINLDERSKLLSPVQKAMIETNGTQCGFCTLGFVMSFTGFVLGEQKTYKEAIAAIDGNICRCTGYKSIERSAKIITAAVAQKPTDDKLAWLVNSGFLPAYFTGIEKRLKELKKTAPSSENGTGVGPLMVAGGTDLLVQKPSAVKSSSLELLHNSATLKGIIESNGQCFIGGGVTVTEFLESPIIQKTFSGLQQIVKLVSSTPIRNMATMGGNIVNASPIGDMTVFFLGLDAGLVLSNGAEERTLPLKDFYTGYKQTLRKPNEVVTEIFFTLPDSTVHFNFEKVCKRMTLDIASVNTACSLRLSPDGTIERIHLSAGGIAPFPKYFSKTVAWLNGKKPSFDNFQQALKIMDDEIAPISDARGSSAYKRLLLRQLVIAHFLKFFGPTEDVKKLLAL